MAGLTRLVGSDVKVQFEVSGKRYGDYPARRFRPHAVLSPSGFDDATTDIRFGLKPLQSTAAGQAFGVEAFVQKKFGASPLYGQVSTSLNRTRLTSIDGSTTRGAFDSPLTANAVLWWRPNARWELATRLREASGLPVTPFVTSGPLAGALDFARCNSDRLQTFFAADVRVDRRFIMGRTQFIAFIDLQNITNRQNQAPEWNPRTLMPDRQTGAALLPSIGLNWEF